jgi:hypothetical protein
MELPAKIFSRLFHLPAIIQPAKIFPGCFSFAGCYGALKACRLPTVYFLSWQIHWSAGTDLCRLFGAFLAVLCILA